LISHRNNVLMNWTSHKAREIKHIGGDENAI
jgi:hypothetical protein